MDYKPLSVVNDLINVVNTRIGTKDLEFTIDLDPRLPQKLYGDSVRIHQILLNLLNNAVKFTERGMWHLKLYSEPVDADTIMLKAVISDTGIGIKKENMGKLFQSFQQVDSKRNRNIEGSEMVAMVRKWLPAGVRRRRSCYVQKGLEKRRQLCYNRIDADRGSIKWKRYADT